MTQPARSGPLRGMRILEVGGIGPGPFAGMMLADMGAQVVRIERADAPIQERGPTARGRQLLDLDLKDAAACEKVKALAARSDVLIEGFRPGVMERLGLGPQVLCEANERLVYARMTGWGQSGPLAQTAGHDIDYIAITGALSAMGPADREPPVPLNLVGDYGGGAMYLVAGILAACLEAQRSGRGQVVDAAICDGTVSMMSLFHQLRHEGRWHEGRGTNVLDGSAPFYRAYSCRDGLFLAVGAVEPQFYAQLRRIAGWHEPLFDDQYNERLWPAMTERAQALMLARTRDEWMQLFEGSDACVAPVLSLEESLSHPHLQARGSFVEIDGLRQPAPAPRFSRTPSQALASERSTRIEDLITQWSQPCDARQPA